MDAVVDISGVVLETKRLRIREWTLDDLDDFYEYASVEGVGEFAGWFPHKDKDESLTILNYFIQSKHTFAIEHKEESKVIGSIGIEKTPDVLDEFETLIGREIGYVLSKEYWGKGYMSEAVTAVIDYCFNIVKCDYLLCGYFLGNDRSKRVMEKQGFVPYKMIKSEHIIGTKEVQLTILRRKDA